MGQIATFTKRVGQTRNTFVICIPKDVAVLLALKRKDIVQIQIRKLQGDVAS